MNRSLILILIFPLLAWETVLLEDLRSMFFRSADNKCLAQSIIEYTDPLFPDQLTSVQLAYRGAALTMLADCVKNPVKKYKRFNQGKALIEDAVAENPYSVEIRYLRFMVQDNMPGFLMYDDRSGDLSIIMSGIGSVIYSGETDFGTKIIRSLLTSEFPDQGQREQLTAFIAKE